jgi:hypothetical protein
MVKAAPYYAAFQATQYQVPDIDYGVDSKQPENGLVLGVLDNRNCAVDRKSVLGQLADNQIGFVPFRYRDDGVGPRYACPPEVNKVCPVALNYYASQLFPNELATRQALLQDNYLMLLYHQQF